MEDRIRMIEHIYNDSYVTDIGDASHIPPSHTYDFNNEIKSLFTDIGKTNVKLDELVSVAVSDNEIQIDWDEKINVLKGEIAVLDNKLNRMFSFRQTCMPACDIVEFKNNPATNIPAPYKPQLDMPQKTLI